MVTVIDAVNFMKDIQVKETESVGFVFMGVMVVFVLLVFVCVFVCLFARLFVCLFVCLFQQLTRDGVHGASRCVVHPYRRQCTIKRCVRTRRDGGGNNR